MKNIHVLPTDKPSRIRIGNNGNFVIGLAQNATVSKNDSYTNQNIYITSDEEIKVGDWIISSGLIYKVNANVNLINPNKDKKIILTTDQDLIKDGVQAIDDEFLEWFVKNPSCEEVEIERDSREVGSHNGGIVIEYGLYEIIIPKEEPKQEEWISPMQSFKTKEEPKQETLEEFIQRQLSLGKYQDQESAIKYSILAFAKWQQEQDKNKYSEEEVLDILFSMSVDNPNNITKWFEQFKNK